MRCRLCENNFVPDDAVLNLELGWPLRSHKRSASSPKFRSGDAAGGFALVVKLPCHGASTGLCLG
jgi:hypothetical protein